LRLLADLPAEIAARIHSAWGEPQADPDVRDCAFRFRAQSFGNITVALPPDRGRPGDRRANYHDPALPPRHASLCQFGTEENTMTSAYCKMRHCVVQLAAISRPMRALQEACCLEGLYCPSASEMFSEQATAARPMIPWIRSIWLQPAHQVI